MGDYKINKLVVFIAIAMSIIPIIVCVIAGISLIYAFLLSLIFITLTALKNGMDLKYIKTIIREGVLECKSLYLVILLIGATVSVWISSGVVPTMIYYGLTYLQNVNFLFAGFLMIAISAVFMGTAIGTVSTIGIAILGIGRGFNIPDYILVGMIVSGAFMADKISPISGLLNLTLTTTNTSYKETVKCSLKTMIPTILICALIYYMIGRNYINLDKDNIFL